jgi:hypothetical protein
MNQENKQQLLNVLCAGYWKAYTDKLSSEAKKKAEKRLRKCDFSSENHSEWCDAKELQVGDYFVEDSTPSGRLLRCTKVCDKSVTCAMVNFSRYGRRYRYKGDNYYGLKVGDYEVPIYDHTIRIKKNELIRRATNDFVWHGFV